MFYYNPADGLAAHAIPYDGPTVLTPREQQILYQGDFGDLTMAMLYVMIEGLGWRPGGWHHVKAWPSRDALLDAWRYWKSGYPEWMHGDPEGELVIALHAYVASDDGNYGMDDKIRTLARAIDREMRSLASPVQRCSV
jgi:hypothetical protein